MRLREMAGSDERDLLGSMGRIPDNSYQLDTATKILQWRWDTSYIAEVGRAYQRVGWGMWMPIGGFPPTLVRQGCIVEWTVTKGSTQSYRWQGNGCTTVTIHATRRSRGIEGRSTPPPIVAAIVGGPRERRRPGGNVDPGYAGCSAGRNGTAWSTSSRPSGRRSRSGWRRARRCASRCRARSHADYDKARRPGRSGRHPRAAECRPASEAGAGALCPHARLALRLPARLGGGDGGRPRRARRSPACPSAPAATCTSPISASSPRPSATWSSPSTTSTKSIPDRGSGTSSAWRRAPRWRRASWAATRTRPPRPRRAIVRSYRKRMRRYRRDGLSRGLVRPHRRAGGARHALAKARRGAERAMDKARGKGHMPGARQADRGGRRRASHHRGTCR